MGIEFELKFSATPEQQSDIASVFLTEYHTIEMETTYFDTADHRLSDRHITLRCRKENGVAVCTVKTPSSGYGRGEWECECDEIRLAVPKLCGLGAPRELLFLTAEGVEPVCGAKFTRRCALLTFKDAQLELALDRGILSGGGKQLPLCEVEVELKDGQPETAMEFATELAERFGLEPQHKSKFRRALALARGE